MTLHVDPHERDAAVDAMRRELSSDPFGLDLTVGGAGDARWIQLPPASGADYRWSFWFYTNGERHIYATAWPEAADATGDDAVIWYHPFELEDYDRSTLELEAAFRAEAQRLLRTNTRIRSKRLLVNWSVDLEESSDGVRWERVYGFRAWRGGGPIARRHAEGNVLRSPPLIRGIANAR